ncbi:MAG: glucans biosynthesis glucosyltransferase MdoH [Labrys sp. (in: a-proteobacteria)]
MDSVTLQPQTGAVLAVGALPPEAPLAMPTQSLERWSPLPSRTSADSAPIRTWPYRLFIFGGMAALTAVGAWQMYQVVAVGTITLLEWALLILFVVNFSWIALAFTSAVVGFWVLVRRSQAEPRLATDLTSRTAMLMPIYNESPARVFGAMQAMIESIEATGRLDAFDFFFLSDTTDPDIWIAEERAFLAMRRRLGASVRLWYRHRARNVGRKSGNIEDWVTRWGGAYDHMLVLDADSLMTGDAVVTLARAMQADPDAGIIQTLPLIINRSTLFARVQQFAARVYGPVIATGLAAWMGRDGNYWGHNAVIRTAAFAAHAGMPKLSGKPPFGGHILSHDFVEAALIRRAGYAVIMYPQIVGSYEESPPSLIDVAARDRRWCQGNLQHARVIGSAGLHPASRQHFATGIMSYLASPLWLLQLIVGIMLVLQAHFVRPEYFTDQFSLFPTWPLFDAERSLNLFLGTMAILLAPKFLGLLIALRDRATRRACGGTLPLMASTIIEVILSALLAPVMMLIQSGSVFEILLGRDSGWKPQRRDDGTIPLRDIIRRHRSHVALGVVAGLSAYVMSPFLFAWMSPTILGLVLAIPLSWASASLAAGLWLKRRGLLRTPEEITPPPIALRARDLADAYAADDEGEALRHIHADPDFRELHEDMLPPGARGERGHFDTVKVLAQAKITEARTLDEACIWLTPQERFALLHDRALLALLARLPAAEPKRLPLAAE